MRCGLNAGEPIQLARTIADMAGSDAIIASHLAEAVQYRQRVRG